MAFDNNKLGELRPNQIITTFGPGSVVDAVKDSVTILDISYWKQKGQKIIDGRLASYFGDKMSGIIAKMTTRWLRFTRRLYQLTSSKR